MNITEALNAICERRNLSQAEAKEIFDIVMSGSATAAQIGGLLTALRTKGETSDEIAGAARAMRDASTKVSVSADYLVDTCGTGGSGASKLFNVSTAAAFVAAAAGAHVAKHGNRKASSNSGSADVLETAGVNINLTPQQVAACITEVGVGFLFAASHHPAMRFAGPVRQELGVRTIFNLLGPLTNPAGARRQVLGVFAPEWQTPIAEVLRNLGAEHALVVHAAGLDELSVSSSSSVVELKGGEIDQYEVHPRDFGMDLRDTAELRAATPEESLRLIRESLSVTENTLASDLVALNGGAAIYVSGIAPSLSSGVELAREAIASGKASERFDQLVKVTQLMSADE